MDAGAVHGMGGVVGAAWDATEVVGAARGVAEVGRCSVVIEIYLESARVTYFNVENQVEARELDSNLLEEKRNRTLANVWKYQESLKRYYNKSVVQRELNIRDLVLKKDIRTKDKHKFLSPWEGQFIIVDIAAPWAYVLVEVDIGMISNTCNVDQLRKYYA
jgi:hypothetical protein